MLPFKMNKNEFKNSISHQLVDAVDYASGSVVIKSILRKKTGTVTLSSFDAGETLPTKTSPFDNLIQIIDGEAEITVDEISNKVVTGQVIIIPAHIKNSIKASMRFKMLTTIIKSGYEDVNL
jgi:quercetin dioxygenase-like cupin family protein